MKKQILQFAPIIPIAIGIGTILPSLWEGSGMGCIAQPYVHQIIILNEGQYDYINQVQLVPVTIGVYSPSAQSYTVIDTIANARFGSDVIIDGQYFYVSADSFLLKYDANSYQQVAAQIVHGIRKFAMWNNQLLVSRGDVVSFNSYFQVYDKNSLGWIYELDTVSGPKYSAEGITVFNDSAYLAINNGYQWGNEKGLLGIISLQNQNYAAEIDLGPDGINPDGNVMRQGSMIYTLNNKDFTGSSVTTFDASDRTHSTVNVAIVSGCGISVLALNYVYYQEYALGKLARFDVNTQNIYDTLASTIAFYGMLNDTINNLIYGTSTDYASYGTCYIMQYDGTMLDSFSVGVSPGNMALDVRTATALPEQDPSSQIVVYPNPANGKFNLLISRFENLKMKELKVYNVFGECIHQQIFKSSNQHIDLSSHPDGIYFIRLSDEKNTRSYPLIISR